MPDANASRARRIVIAGGSGFLGSNLARWLGAREHQVVVLARSTPQNLPPNCRHAPWDGRSVGPWAGELDGATAVVNLAGRTVDCIKTPEHRDEILRSRVESTRTIGEAMRSVATPPRVWVQMRTAHIYGDPADTVCDERSAFGYGLAPTVGRAWENACHESCPSGVRTVLLRTSFVIGRSGGPLPRLRMLARLGLGGTIGHGRQGISWIHERDMNRLFERAITDTSMTGAYLATAPTPVSNREFMRELRRAIGQPIGLPAAAWMVRIGAPVLLRTDPELATLGRYCVPTRLLAHGFEFDFPTLREAMHDLARPDTGTRAP